MDINTLLDKFEFHDAHIESIYLSKDKDTLSFKMDFPINEWKNHGSGKGSQDFVRGVCQFNNITNFYCKPPLEGFFEGRNIDLECLDFDLISVQDNKICQLEVLIDVHNFDDRMALQEVLLIKFFSKSVDWKPVRYFKFEQ
jgi:hypothetical protein